MFVNLLMLLSFKNEIFIKSIVIFFIVQAFANSTVQSQNLFANADFEILNNCTEYHQDCSPEAWFYIKPAATPLIYNKIVPNPFSGKDLLILPIENLYKPIAQRQQVYTLFCCSLQKDKQYKLSFYINTAAKSFYGIDFVFSDKEFTTQTFNADSVKTSIHINKEDIVNELAGWNFVETIYTATGNEKYCLIGNVSKQKYEYDAYQRMNKGGDVFYFIDDIVFKPVQSMSLCNDYKKNVEKLFAQNLRHTEQVLINPFVLVKKDTLQIPAVFFENDKANIKPVFVQKLQSMLQSFSTKNILSVHVIGHTDNKGTILHNITLSQQRAISVKKFLSNELKNNLFVISTEGKGDSLPIADNSTAIGRATNRRVEIIITYE